jgi:hypothetical protein
VPVLAKKPGAWRNGAPFKDGLLPSAGRRRACHRLHDMMAHHLQKAPVEGPLLAGEHSVDRRLHVVANTALAGALEERERLFVGIEHHLLGFARVSPHERHAAVAQPHVRDLGDGRGSVDDHVLVAGVLSRWSTASTCVLAPFLQHAVESSPN